MVAKLVESRTDQIRQLCERFGVRRLEVFGSAVNGDFDTTSSDLDFLVEFAPMSPRSHADSYFGLAAALRDLFRRDIDLVEIDGIANPYVRASIERSRAPIYVNA